MTSWLGLAGSAVAFATTGIYLALILSEGNDAPAEFVPWAAAFGGIGIAAAVASFLAPGRARRIAFVLAGITALLLGLLALLSIGILLLAVAALLLAAAREPRSRAG